MPPSRTLAILVAALCLLAPAGEAGAAFFNTVAFAPDATADGLGIGVLQGVAVTYTTAAGARGNSGTTLPGDFTSSLATSPVVTGVSSGTAGVFGVTSGTQANTITFSSAVVNPYLFVDFTDANTTFDFSGTSINFLSSRNAQLSGSLITFVGSTDSIDDGFAAQLIGTFTSITFRTTLIGNQAESQKFTIGLAPVPEPSSLALGVIAGAISLAAWPRHRRSAAARPGMIA